MKILFFILILILLRPSILIASLYQDGDIIFHQSQSNQAKAIYEATGSHWSHVGILFQRFNQWYVAEAVQPVRFISLSSFVARGKNQSYKILRLPGLTDIQKIASRMK